MDLAGQVGLHRTTTNRFQDSVVFRLNVPEGSEQPDGERAEDQQGEARQRQNDIIKPEGENGRLKPKDRDNDQERGSLEWTKPDHRGGPGDTDQQIKRGENHGRKRTHIVLVKNGALGLELDLDAAQVPPPQSCTARAD